MRRALTALLLLAACRDAERPPEDAPAVANAPTEMQSRELAPAEAPEIELFDAGAEPRARLRLRPEVGAEMPLRIELAMSMTVVSGGTAAPPMSMPRVLVDGRLVVDSVSDDEIRVRHLVDAIDLRGGEGVPEALARELKDALAGATSYRASLRVDPRGFVRGGVVDVPTSAGPAGQILAQLGQAYGQSLVAFPREPVGVGARWTATSDVEQAGMKLRQTSTYTLPSRDGDALVVHADVAQDLLRADLGEGLVPGVRAKLVKFSAKGTSDTTLELSAAGPRTSEHHTEVRMILDVDAAGEAARQEIDLSFDVALRGTASP